MDLKEPSSMVEPAAGENVNTPTYAAAVSGDTTSGPKAHPFAVHTSYPKMGLSQT